MTKNPSKQYDNWDVELLRFTGFPSPDFQINEPNWWQELTGEPSENRNIQPRMSLIQEKGSYEEGELILKVEPFRIDWVFKTIPKPEEQTLITLGEFQNTLTIFKELMDKWFKVKDFPSFQRIAFGAILLQPVKDRYQGYINLSNYLKPFISIDTKNSSDFFYQINRPRESKTDISGLKINRLTKWSIRKSNWASFNAEQSKIITGQESFACQLELDINNIPNLKRILNAKECSIVLNELIDLSLEISKKGDIK